ncbi:MAG: serine O-acetyltransferase EpsC [Anaerolineaceae bacterium]
MKKWFNVLRNDVQSVLDRDPAARGYLEIILLYPGLHAIWSHRVAHWFWKRKLFLFARGLSQLSRFITGIEIHPGAKIGSGFFIDHGMGVVIGETSEIGKNVTLYHGVTLGGVSTEKGKRHPTIEDNVVVGAGAKILGAILIGKGSRVGANAVVVSAVPPNSVVVGVPGQTVKRSVPQINNLPDLHHDLLPDTIGKTIASLMERMDRMEQSQSFPLTNHPRFVAGDKKNEDLIHIPVDGIWTGSDFSI